MTDVVVGILIRENKILIAERPQDKPYSGYWEFPGGKVEAQETHQKALNRELYEELGIHVQAAQQWFAHTHVYPDKTIFLDIWLVTQFSGEPQSKENQILRWVSLKEMQEFPLLAGNYPILEKFEILQKEGLLT